MTDSQLSPCRSAFDWLIEVDRLLSACGDIQANSPLHREIIKFITQPPAPIDVEALKRECLEVLVSKLSGHTADICISDISTVIDHLHRTNRLNTIPHKENDDD
jgi:hypothetical protein